MGFDGGEVVEQKKLLAIVLGLVVAAFLFFLWRKPNASKISPSPGISAIEKKWEFTAGGKIFGALAMADDGTLYAAAEDGFVYALNGSGNLQWKTYIGPTRSAPSVGPDGAIYIANSNGRVLALNHSGTVRWTADVYQGNTWGENGSAIGRDYLYIPARGSLCAVRLSNGQVDWQSPWGGEQWGAVTLLPDGTTLSPGRGRLNGIDSRGEIAWQYPPNGRSRSEQRRISSARSIFRQHGNRGRRQPHSLRRARPGKIRSHGAGWSTQVGVEDTGGLST